MPSFSQALSSILLTSALTTWPITTTTAHPLFLSYGGRSNDHRRAGKYKNSKKQIVKLCTPDNFAGVYKYMNCQDVETKVVITCDNDNGIYRCDYKEKPMNDDNGDDICVGVVEGSFDATYVMMDPARPGVCQLNFVSLKDSCKADALPPGFGMRAEVDMTAGHADTSTMLLWFSTDEGVVYYNEDEPQETAFLHQDLSKGRKLRGCTTCDPNFPNACQDNNCATESVWKDGCAECLCYKNENGSWCDGTNNAHYDIYFELHGENPWGDHNLKNRKCNTKFKPANFAFPCYHDWQCEKGYECTAQKYGGRIIKYCS